MAPCESFAQGAKRFAMLEKFMHRKGDGWLDDLLYLYNGLSEELKSGAFGDRTPAEMTDELLEILLVSEKLREKLFHLRARYRKDENGDVIESEDHVSKGVIIIFNNLIQ